MQQRILQTSSTLRTLFRDFVWCKIGLMTKGQQNQRDPFPPIPVLFMLTQVSKLKETLPLINVYFSKAISKIGNRGVVALSNAMRVNKCLEVLDVSRGEGTVNKLIDYANTNSNIRDHTQYGQTFLEYSFTQFNTDKTRFTKLQRYVFFLHLFYEFLLVDFLLKDRSLFLMLRTFWAQILLQLTLGTELLVSCNIFQN